MWCLVAAYGICYSYWSSCDAGLWNMFQALYGCDSLNGICWLWVRSHASALNRESKRKSEGGLCCRGRVDPRDVAEEACLICIPVHCCGGIQKCVVAACCSSFAHICVCSAFVIRGFRFLNV
jgi:hypothetical protein